MPTGARDTQMTISLSNDPSIQLNEISHPPSESPWSFLVGKCCFAIRSLETLSLVLPTSNTSKPPSQRRVALFVLNHPLNSAKSPQREGDGSLGPLLSTNRRWSCCRIGKYQNQKSDSWSVNHRFDVFKSDFGRCKILIVDQSFFKVSFGQLIVALAATGQSDRVMSFFQTDILAL